MIDAHLQLLNRESAILDAQEFEPTLHVLDEMVNYGTQMIAKLASGEGRTFMEQILICHLLRDFIVNVDATSVLLANGCSDASITQCRSIVERAHQIEWTLKSDAETKMEYLFVSDLRAELHAAKAIQPGTEENQKVFKLLHAVPDCPQMIESGKRKALSVQTTLNSDSFREINSVFDRLARKQKFEPSWTKAYCEGCNSSPNSVKCNGSALSIAKCLDKESDYEFMFSPMSNTAHGSSLAQSMSIKGKVIEVRSIRAPALPSEAFPTIPAIIVRCYQQLLLRFHPDQADALLDHHLRVWKPRLSLNN